MSRVLLNVLRCLAISCIPQSVANADSMGAVGAPGLIIFGGIAALIGVVAFPILGFFKVHSLRKKRISNTLDRVTLLILFSPLVLLMMWGIWVFLLIVSSF